MFRSVGILRWAVLFAALLTGTAYAQGDAKPKVRAITAFVHLERAAYAREVGDALAVLRSAKSELSKQGYEVQSIRIVTQPLGELVSGQSEADSLAFLKLLDELSAKEKFLLSVGPAMLRDADDPRAIRLLAKALTTLPRLNGNAIIAGHDGIHWKVIRETAALVRYVADHTGNVPGNFNFTTTAMLEPFGPFFPGAWHDSAGKAFSIGFESANVVQDVFARTHGDFAASVAQLTEQLTVHAKVAESVGRRVGQSTGWVFMGVDPTPAPSEDLSIATAMESFTGARFGSSGTMTAAFAITTAVKAVPVQQIGYSGLMLPVMEDPVLAQRWAERAISTDVLLAYSAVCGTGLDTIPYPGDITEAQLARIFGDVASLAWKWKKPLSARLLPLVGKKAGEKTEVKSFANTTLQELP